jgi:hypothetical protein
MFVPVEDSEFAWLKEAHGLPETFERTTCVLHAMQEDLSIQDWTLTWDQWEKQTGVKEARLHRMRARSPSGEQIANALSNMQSPGGSPLPGAELRRISWREIARRHDLDVRAMVKDWALWRPLSSVLDGPPRYLVGAAVEGLIDPESAAHLITALRRVEGDESCLFHFFSGLVGGWGHDTPFVVKGSLEDMNDLITERAKRGGAGPDYWWPEDRRWCVYTDYDSTVTWVGGSSDLIAAIEDDSWIETFSPEGGD